MRYNGGYMRKSVRTNNARRQSTKPTASPSRRWILHLGLRLGLVLGSCLLVFGGLTFRDIDARQREQVKSDQAHAELMTQLTEKRLAREHADRAIVASRVQGATTSLPKLAEPPELDDLACNHSRTHNDPSSYDVLINKQHCVWPLTYTPELATVAGEKVAATIAPDAEAMLEAARSEGYTFRITSGYRSFSEQAEVFRYWLNSTNRLDKTMARSALPGYSEHQTGLAIDLALGSCVLECLRETPAYEWLNNNAHLYGFVERYEQGHESTTGYLPEAWHYRYIGHEAAAAYHESGAKTLEEFWQMPGGDYS